MDDILLELQKYCLEALQLKDKDLCACRMFQTTEGYPVVFLFQKAETNEYYLCKTNVENPVFERLDSFLNKDATHHQSKIWDLREILGEEIVFQLIKQGLFFSDKKQKRTNDEAIRSFINSKYPNDNSSFQLQRLVCLLQYPLEPLFGKEAHHLDLNGFNNKGENIIPVILRFHTGENSIHHNSEGNYRPDIESVKLGSLYRERFLEFYKSKLPSNTTIF